MKLSLTKTLALAAALFVSSHAAAQGQLVRGDVDTIRNTNLFRLDCTNIPLVSTTVNLQALHDASRQQDIEYEMRVINTGTATSPVLNVLSATAIPEPYEMGNIRLGRSDTWEVLGPAGALAVIFVGSQTDTGYLPLGAAGTWNMGPSATLFFAGAIPAFGRLQFSYAPPNNNSLVGLTVVSQAVTIAGQTLTVLNPACREIRAN